MNINKKIEEIRQKPEHIRLRYVWGSVTVCMMLIFVIWLMSIQIKLRDVAAEDKSTTMDELSKKLQSAKENSLQLTTPQEEQRIPVEEAINDYVSATSEAEGYAPVANEGQIDQGQTDQISN